MSPIRIAMIGPFGLRRKSTMRERALPMAQALVRAGHAVRMVIPAWDSPEDAGRRWEDQGVQVVHPSLPRAPAPLFQLALTRACVREALRGEPEVVHLFKPKAYAGLAHLALHALRGVGRFGGRLVVDEDDWEVAWNDVNPYSALEKRLFAWQERWGLRHADAITVASTELDGLVQGLGIPTERIAYLPNAVRPLALAAPPSLSRDAIRARYGLEDRPTVLLYTRFVEFRLPTLLSIIAALAERVPQARWLVVGQGFFQEEQALAESLASGGLGGSVAFAGWLDAGALPAVFLAVDAALHLYEDTVINRTKCSVKLLDLLAAGVPVAASAVGQNRAYIEHGRTGLLVPAGDIAAHAEALATLLRDGALRQRLGAAAADAVKRAYTWDALIPRLAGAYARPVLGPD